MEMTHVKPQPIIGIDRRACTYLVQILTADKAEAGPQVPSRQSETRDIKKMRSRSSVEPRIPAFYNLSFSSGLLYSSDSPNAFPPHQFTG